MVLTVDRIRSALARCDGTFQPDGFIDVRQAKPAGVVVPIVLAPTPSVLFVLRGAHLKDHAGEVGLPGGKPEPWDADLRATALRELGEEIGLGEADITWLGCLTPRPVITGRYLIHPFVAAVREGASPRVTSPEVQRILSLPLLPLIMGELPFYAIPRAWGGPRLLVPHFRLGEPEAVLYGATAHIFHELLSHLAAELGVPVAEPIVEDAPPWGDRYPEADAPPVPCDDRRKGSAP